MTEGVSRVGSIPIDQIIASMVLRPVKKPRVDFLVWDFGIQGQLQPVLVVQRVDGFHLLDGMHRVAAARVLKRTVLDAKILPPETSENEARFAALMANINREELTKLERAEYLADLDAEIKRINPGARHGGDRRSQKVAKKRMDEHGGFREAIFASRTELAEILGISDRLIKMANEIVGGLTAETKKRIRDQRTDEHPKGTWLEEHQSDLLKLAKLDSVVQSQVCDLLFSNPPQAKSVEDAKVLIDDERPIPRADKLYTNLISTWGRLPENRQEAFVEQFWQTFLTIARRKGLAQ